MLLWSRKQTLIYNLVLQGVIMAWMQIELTDEQDKIVRHAQVDWGFVDKRDAIKRIIHEWNRGVRTKGGGQK